MVLRVGLPVNGCAGMMLRGTGFHGCRAIGAGASAARFTQQQREAQQQRDLAQQQAERLAERLRAMELILTN